MRSRVVRATCGILLGALVSLSTLGANRAQVHAAGTGAVGINSVTISGGNVVINASASDLPDSDDGVYYLFAERPYQTVPSGSAVATAPVGASASFQVPLGYNTASNHLYDKFQIAVKQGGALVPVCGAKYITNPQVLAGSSPQKKNNGKKGLILDSAKIGSDEVKQLGVQQGAYNINICDVVGGNKAISYDYNGTTFHFDSAAMGMYDLVVKTVSAQGIGLTMVLLNPYSKGEDFLIAPTSRNGLGRHRYYMMNTSEEKGLSTLEAVASFLAQRYNGQNGYGQVDNWVIANEVNAKSAWNYSSVVDEMAYAQLYADELRVCYNAIKSRNANATVCISVDQNWTHVHTPSSYYSARSMIEAINYCISTQGNIDWALAAHPYNYPLTYTPFWTPQSETAAAMITHGIDTPYLSMDNIEQLTDYMGQPAMRGTSGEVRPILLTEVGYTSTQGEEAQAAAILYAYQRVATNRYIRMIIFNRQTDDSSEMREGLAVGLTRKDGSRKLSFEFFQQMNGGNAGSYIQRAAAIMGISDWNAAMRAR